MFASSEAGIEEDSGAGDLFLRYVGCVVRADFVEDDTLATASESILEEDEHDEDGAGAKGDQRGSDEEFVPAPCSRKDEEIYWSYENTKDHQNEDEEDEVGGFFPEGGLKRPAGLEISPQVPGAMPAGIFDGITHQFDGLFGLKKAAVGEALEVHVAPTKVGVGGSHRALLDAQAVEIGCCAGGVDEKDATEAVPPAQGAPGSHRERVPVFVG